MKQYKVVFFNRNNAVVATADLEASSEEHLLELINQFVDINNLLDYVGSVRWEASTIVLTGSVSR